MQKKGKKELYKKKVYGQQEAESAAGTDRARNIEAVLQGRQTSGENNGREQIAANLNLDINDIITDEHVLRYAQAYNIKKVNSFGYPTSEYDFDVARAELKKKLMENPDATVDEIIEDEQKVPEPEDNKKY